MNPDNARRASVLSLFTSTSTLICCALPALLVTLGMGVALSSLVAVVPAIVWLSEYKAQVFGMAGGMLVLAGWLQWRARFAPCPADPLQADACQRMRRRSQWIYLGSCGVYGIGLWFAFAAPWLAG